MHSWMTERFVSAQSACAAAHRPVELSFGNLVRSKNVSLERAELDIPSHLPTHERSAENGTSRHLNAYHNPRRRSLQWKQTRAGVARQTVHLFLRKCYRHPICVKRHLMRLPRHFQLPKIRHELSSTLQSHRSQLEAHSS